MEHAQQCLGMAINNISMSDELKVGRVFRMTGFHLQLHKNCERGLQRSGVVKLQGFQPESMCNGLYSVSTYRAGGAVRCKVETPTCSDMAVSLTCLNIPSPQTTIDSLCPLQRS